MRPGCAMTCAATSWSTSPTRARCWSWTYADPGAMPRLVLRDASVLDGAGFWGWPGLRCSA